MSRLETSGETPREPQTIVMTRLFDAPPELVFEAWTNPELLLRWFAPRNCEIHFATIDVRPGGGFHSCVRNPHFGECWCVGTYEEIVASQRLSYTMAIADEHGNKIESLQAGHDPLWPRETKVVVTFDKVGDQTRLTLRQNVSEALAKQTGAYPSWLEMLDRLAESLQRARGGSGG